MRLLLGGRVQRLREPLLLLPSGHPLPPRLPLSSALLSRRPTRPDAWPLHLPCVWLPQPPRRPWLPPRLWPWRRQLLAPQQYALLLGAGRRERARLRQIVSFVVLRT